MALSQVKVIGKISLPDGEVASIKSITFTLTASDYEDRELVAKKPIPAEHLGGGAFEVELWPNDAGYFADTRYQVKVELDGGASVDPLPLLYIRKEQPIHDLDLLVIEQETLVVGYQNRVIAKSLFDSLTTHTPGLIYLVVVV